MPDLTFTPTAEPGRRFGCEQGETAHEWRARMRRLANENPGAPESAALVEIVDLLEEMDAARVRRPSRARGPR